MCSRPVALARLQISKTILYPPPSKCHAAMTLGEIMDKTIKQNRCSGMLPKKKAWSLPVTTWQVLVASFSPAHEHVSVSPLHTKLYSIRRKFRSGWLWIKRNALYRFVTAIIPQDKIVLLSSSPDDKFSNITALSKKMRELSMSFIWLTKEQFQDHPFRSLAFLARAHVLVIDAASPAARIRLHRNTCLIHCWHAGGAYKKVAFDAKRKNYDEASEEKRIKRIHRGISWFVCTSEETASTYAKAFHLPIEQMLVFGSPRLDAVLKQADCPAPQIYTVLYAPTYRTQHKNARYLPPLPDAEKLRNAIEARLGENVHLAFRSHPTAPVPEHTDGWEDWSNIPQHEALRSASVLITDYSSIFFDFLPYRRPIVFYVPDFCDYQSHERELYFSPYEAFPETSCSDEQSLVEILVQCRHMKVDYREIWQKHMSACDGKASERLCAFIQKIMKRDIQ